MRIYFLIQKGPKKITAYKIILAEKLDLRELEILLAFRKRAENEHFTIQLNGLCAVSGTFKEKGISLIPWEKFF